MERRGKEETGKNEEKKEKEGKENNKGKWKRMKRKRKEKGERGRMPNRKKKKKTEKKFERIEGIERGGGTHLSPLPPHLCSGSGESWVSGRPLVITCRVSELISVTSPGTRSLQVFL